MEGESPLAVSKHALQAELMRELYRDKRSGGREEKEKYREKEEKGKDQPASSSEQKEWAELVS